MMKRQMISLTLVLGLAATAVFAHDGVKDPDVKKRMALMGNMRATMAVLGRMAQGKTAFDPATAAGAKAAFVKDADAIIAAFKKPAQDPKSESAPAIWEDFADFNAKADAFGAASARLDVSTLAQLRAGIGAVGQSCGGCHKAYRIEK